MLNFDDDLPAISTHTHAHPPRRDDSALGLESAMPAYTVTELTDRPISYPTPAQKTMTKRRSSSTKPDGVRGRRFADRSVTQRV